MPRTRARRLVADSNADIGSISLKRFERGRRLPAQYYPGPRIPFFPSLRGNWPADPNIENKSITKHQFFLKENKRMIALPYRQDRKFALDTIANLLHPFTVDSR
ncbi:hypothetical protein [Burkholderia thailandensis]|uniref:hypothetical protein n=1 Tax=Burkholderia thailandensis TaxID=57975 RepID=UPI000B18025D|nr:hypothetical protein [Burkholderia thailandensis]MBS2129580.1 hypothetical protein [Burkholderia thailandensis]MCS3396721.1 hypothetical protein [Burkholderia thailandensis]MCS6469500.1 hypothetical protein [Burkholderia thailandensis]MCS6497092.1 hypothetical protein [Burkholderia thailandensis]MCS6499525.1 hypothetical protein [Burkholderia thailandensis]